MAQGAPKRKRVDLSGGDVYRGDPAVLMFGKEEKSAARHAPPPQKPQGDMTKREIGARARDVREYRRRLEHELKDRLREGRRERDEYVLRLGRLRREAAAIRRTLKALKGEVDE